MSYWPAYLAHNERRRVELATVARAHVERLSSPVPILAAWERLFRYVQSGQRPDSGPSPNHETADLAAGGRV